MSATRSVLVLTQQFDPTADKVVEELNNRGMAVFRVDAADFPQRLSVRAELTGQGWSGELRTALRTLDLATVAGIYYRRPTQFELHPNLADNERRWAAGEARMGFGGLLAALEPWLNHPSRIGSAEYKPLQLRAAGACGMRVPRTILSNDPDAAQCFAREVGHVVYKPFTSCGIAEPKGLCQLFTTRISPEQCDADISRTMHLFQEWVPKQYEVRLTVVDQQFFAARIDAGSPAAAVDWRSDYESLTYTPIETPQPLRAQVRDLLDILALRYAALDFIVTDDGDWVFLECNPNGQWAWIEEGTGLPIAAAIARALEGAS